MESFYWILFTKQTPYLKFTEIFCCLKLSHSFFKYVMFLWWFFMPCLITGFRLFFFRRIKCPGYSDNAVNCKVIFHIYCCWCCHVHTLVDTISFWYVMFCPLKCPGCSDCLLLGFASSSVRSLTLTNWLVTHYQWSAIGWAISTNLGRP